MNEILAYLVACYPNANISGQTLMNYSLALQGINAEALERAARQHVAYNKYFPAISELLAPVVRELLPAGARQTADEAYTQVVGAMPSPHAAAEDYDSARSRLGPFLVDVIASVGGWSFLREQRADVARRAFITTFSEHRDRLVARTTADVARLEGGVGHAALPG